MNKLLVGLLVLIAAVLAGPAAAAANKPEQITVAYFHGWPTPNLFSQLKKTYDGALGLTVNWRVFDSGYDMNEALVAGEVQIAYAQSHVPFVLGISRGLDLTMIGVAVDYSANDNCLVRHDAGINRDNAGKLEGNKIATLIGSVSHYKLLKILAHLKVDASKLEILPMQNAQAVSAAFSRGDVVMACSFGSALRSMAQFGSPLMSVDELEAIGLRVFDVVTVSTPFMNQYPETVQRFMDVTEASNNQWKVNPAAMRAVIARAADMDRAGSDATLAGFSFPSAQQQKSDAWLGAAIIDYTKALADFFVEQGRLIKSLERSEYQQRITTRFLR